MRALLFLVVIACGAGCDRPLVIDANPGGTDRLPLSGDAGVEGTTTKTLIFQGQTIPKGAQVLVRETWILRRAPNAKPPGYRITGYYDATQRSEGFVLPSGRTDIYFVSGVLPNNIGNIPIPIEAFQKNP